eukprot:TRINITY_DN65748_c7_g1_i1.p1 TRINITY_DN65748_c7_g1~~TRINITY_DN65748_c7_g1_i1.p1  ORF type:complete len:534 (+),score=52.85 TRINITY_DN65748_c7_g1_i1:45-1646(+)
MTHSPTKPHHATSKRVMVTTQNYHGEMLDGMRHGTGTYVFSNPFFRYTGEYENNQRHGRGVLLLGDGSSYDGEFERGEIKGRGCKRWSDGSTYIGEFHMGEMHGYGLYVGTNGEKYEGEMCSNRRHGQGKLIRKDGGQFEGTFVNHKYHGPGVLKDSQQNMWTGVWNRGGLCGEGKMEGSNGDTYDGEFLDDKRHGTGTYFNALSRVTYSGSWEADVSPESPSGMILRAVHHSGNDAVPFANNRLVLPKCQQMKVTIDLVRKVEQQPVQHTDEEKQALAEQRLQKIMEESKSKKKKAKDLPTIEDIREQIEIEDTQTKLVDTFTGAESGRTLCITFYKLPPTEDEKKRGKKGAAAAAKEKAQEKERAEREKQKELERLERERAKAEMAEKGTGTPPESTRSGTTVVSVVSEHLIPPGAEPVGWIADWETASQPNTPHSTAPSDKSALSKTKRGTKKATIQPSDTESVLSHDQLVYKHTTIVDKGRGVFANLFMQRHMETGHYILVVEDDTPNLANTTDLKKLAPVSIHVVIGW